jgi:Putative Flp pilus-assembly TadE/G-like
MVPLMMVLMLLILAAGVGVYWLGFATSQSAGAQTAADAAALAAEKNALDQLMGPVQPGANGAVLPTVDWTAACRAARDYAADNNATVLSCGPETDNASTIGQDARVEVASGSKIPSGAPDAGGAATAWAQASTDPYAQASPKIHTSTQSTCEASTVPGNIPTFASHGGSDGFFPQSGTNYTFGCETRLAGALDKLATAKHLHLTGTAGYVGLTQANSSQPAAVAHGCGDASTTSGLSSVSNTELTQYGLTRPYPGHRDIVELTGISCQPQTTSSDATGTPPISLGNLNVHLVPLRGGPQGSLLGLFAGGASAIGESPLQVGCQIYRVWKSVAVQPDPQKQLLIALMAAQDESQMGLNIGSNTTDPSQSVGVFQQISADGWGTPPEELNVTQAAEMFFIGGHEGGQATTYGMLHYYQQDPSAPPWTIDQETQGSKPGEGNNGIANYGAQANIQAAQTMLGQVTSGQCAHA